MDSIEEMEENVNLGNSNGDIENGDIENLGIQNVDIGENKILIEQDEEQESSIDSAYGRELQSEDTVILNQDNEYIYIDNGQQQVEAIVHEGVGSTDFELQISEDSNSNMGNSRVEKDFNSQDQSNRNDILTILLTEVRKGRIESQEEMRKLREEFLPDVKNELKGYTDDSFRG